MFASQVIHDRSLMRSDAPSIHEHRSSPDCPARFFPSKHKHNFSAHTPTLRRDLKEMHHTLPRYASQQDAAATKIQAWARGMLVRVRRIPKVLKTKRRGMFTRIEDRDRALLQLRLAASLRRASRLQLLLLLPSVIGTVRDQFGRVITHAE